MVARILASLIRRSYSFAFSYAIGAHGGIERISRARALNWVFI
jgi:hypothetical protein